MQPVVTSIIFQSSFFEFFLSLSNSPTGFFFAILLLLLFHLEIRVWLFLSFRVPPPPLPHPQYTGLAELKAKQQLYEYMQMYVQAFQSLGSNLHSGELYFHKIWIRTRVHRTNLKRLSSKPFFFFFPFSFLSAAIKVGCYTIIVKAKRVIHL